MKIAIGTNIFGSYKRQDLCIETLRILKEKCKELGVEIDLYNILFKDEPETIVDGFTTLNVLEKDNITIRDEIKKYSGYINGCLDCKTPDNKIPFVNKRLPLMNELFDTLGNMTEYDYVIFTNSDIMISNRLIKRILENKKESYCVSRTEIRDIDSITEKFRPFKIEVAGFDTYVFKPSWWQENKHRFPNYLLGKPRWDNHFTAIFMRFSDTEILNYYPGHIYHIFHGYDAHSDDVDTRFVNCLWDRHFVSQGCWGLYFDVILTKRLHLMGIQYSGKSEIEDEVFNHICKYGREYGDENDVLEFPDDGKSHDKIKEEIRKSFNR